MGQHRNNQRPGNLQRLLPFIGSSRKEAVPHELSMPDRTPSPLNMKGALLYILAPLLVGIHPILFLYRHNIQHFALADIARALLVMLILTMGLWMIFRWVLHSGIKSSLWVAFFWLLTFSYGPISLALKSMGGVAALLGRHRILIVGWVILLAIGFLLLLKTRASLRTLLHGTVLVMGVLCLTLLAPTLRYHTQRQSIIKNVLPSARQHQPVHSIKPNIYIIILDGYPRHDLLQQAFWYDNTPFEDTLRQRGFYIAQRSHSNYSQTALSVASFLNMRYLDEDLQRLKPMAGDRYPLRMLIKHNGAFQYLRDQGYSIATFSSSYIETDLTQVDRYYHPDGLLTEFEYALIKQTPYAPFWAVRLSDRGANRERMRYAFAHAADPVVSSRPVCVFIHIFACHQPFAFGRHGEKIIPYDQVAASLPALEGRTLFREYFCDQLSYINEQIVTTIDAIRARETRPTAILLLGDHGPQVEYIPATPSVKMPAEGRMKNFIAVSLPGVPANHCYASITPVNLMRTVFNAYFDEGYPLLSDKALFSSYTAPYTFTLVHTSAPPITAPKGKGR